MSPSSIQPPTNRVEREKRVIPAWSVVLIFLAGIALGGIVFAVAWFVFLPKPQPQTDKMPSVVTVKDILPQTETVPATSTRESATSTEIVKVNLAEDKTVASLNIVWHKKPTFKSYREVFGNIIQTTSSVTGQMLDELDASAKPGSESADGNWEMGTVADGPFKGSTLYYQRHNECDPGGCASFMFLLSPGKTQARALNEIYDASGMGESEEYLAARQKLFSMFIQANAIKINAMPDVLKAEDGSVLQLDDNIYFGYSHELYGEWLRDGKFTTVASIGKTSDGRSVWERKDSYDMYVQDDAGLPLRVTSVIPSVEANSDKGIPRHAIVSWDTAALAGKKTSKYYDYATGGCDHFYATRLTADETLKDEDLVQVGTAGGKPVYIPKDASKNQSVKLAYDGWYVADGEKPSFAGFLRQKPVPVFFWKDAFSKWVKYVDTDIQPMAECGKPVIYLYPTKTTAVSVKLPKFIEVTVSDPTYPVGGWKVIAQPSGALNVMPTSTWATSTYGSLYWEGTGVGYQTPTDGFVIKDGQQAVFLRTILPKYGLNKKEAKEFMDFWLPQMVGASYYRVSFLTSAWSQAAPLIISPKPDTSIRIFMDWQRLSAPKTITPPKVVTPARNGFTLVEWGGLLYK